MEFKDFTHQNCRAVNERKSQIWKTQKKCVFVEHLLMLIPVSSTFNA